MSKKLITATVLIVVGEILSLARTYLKEGLSNISPLLTAVVLILSIIAEVIGIILLFICIAEYDKK